MVVEEDNMYKLEDMVKALNDASSPFALANDMPVFQQGMADLLARLQKLEAKDKEVISREE